MVPWRATDDGVVTEDVLAWYERFALVRPGAIYLADECIPGGSTVDDGTYFGVEFAKAGLDYLSLSRGGKFEDAKPPQVGWAIYPYTGSSGWECMPTTLADWRGLTAPAYASELEPAVENR